MKTITSPDNPLLKTIGRLRHRTGKRGQGRFLLEGVKLAREALASGTEIEKAVISNRLYQGTVAGALITRLSEAGVEVVRVPDRLFSRLSSLETPEGILLVAKTPSHSLAALSGELILVVAGSRDPGNMGTLARIAEAAGTDGLVRCRGSANPFQPKALRASMGSLLRIPVYDAGPPEETLPSLGAMGFALAACVTRGGKDYRDADLKSRLALVVGDESTGLSERVMTLSDVRVSVPMKAPVESLNVAFAAGLVLYEAARQRGSL